MTRLAEALTACGLDVSRAQVRVVSGGSINQAYHAVDGDASLFIKCNETPPVDFFHREADGLDLLRRAGVLRVPDVVGVDDGWLALEWIEPGPGTPQGDRALGSSLARLHQTPAASWGHGPDNYMGRLPQTNRPCETFSEFFWCCRLEPLLDHPDLEGRRRRQFNRLAERLPALLDIPEERPCLVHGDFWSGNCFADRTGRAVVIDPAVGHSFREVDLAMTRLFGGFSRDFYEAYHETFPLADGHQDRVGLLNLYPLMVHVHLFGPSYLPGVVSTLDRFT